MTLFTQPHTLSFSTFLSFALKWKRKRVKHAHFPVCKRTPIWMIKRAKSLRSSRMIHPKRRYFFVCARLPSCVRTPVSMCALSYPYLCACAHLSLCVRTPVSMSTHTCCYVCARMLLHMSTSIYMFTHTCLFVCARLFPWGRNYA